MLLNMKLAPSFYSPLRSISEIIREFDYRWKCIWKIPGEFIHLIQTTNPSDHNTWVCSFCNVSKKRLYQLSAFCS
jgi:hypothetical protein